MTLNYKKLKFNNINIIILILDKMTDNKPTITIVLDTEFESSNMITGNFLQIGLVAILNDANLENLDDDHWIVDSLSACFEDQGKEKEKGALEFWDKFQDIHNKIKSESVPIDFGMKNIQSWLNKLSETYTISNFMADISCIDFAWFRNLYLTYCDQSDNKFILPYKAICQYSMAEALVLTGIGKQDIWDCYKSERFPHTHYALDDALKTAYEYLRLKLFIKTQFKR